MQTSFIRGSRPAPGWALTTSASFSHTLSPNFHELQPRQSSRLVLLQKDLFCTSLHSRTQPPGSPSQENLP